MRLAKKSTSFLTDGIINGGKTRAMNLENAHFQLQGLLKDEEKVSAVIDVYKRQYPYSGAVRR